MTLPPRKRIELAAWQRATLLLPHAHWSKPPAYFAAFVFSVSWLVQRSRRCAAPSRSLRARVCKRARSTLVMNQVELEKIVKRSLLDAAARSIESSSGGGGDGDDVVETALRDELERRERDLILAGEIGTALLEANRALQETKAELQDECARLQKVLYAITRVHFAWPASRTHAPRNSYRDPFRPRVRSF